VVHICNPATREAKVKRTAVQGQLMQKHETLAIKKLKQKGLGAWLKWPSKLEALSSNPSISKKDNLQGFSTS
jgi:hypothetical protein